MCQDFGFWWQNIKCSVGGFALPDVLRVENRVYTVSVNRFRLIGINKKWGKTKKHS